MHAVLWIVLALIAVAILLRRRIEERLKVIELVDRLPGPASIPLLGSAWQFEWEIPKFVVQMRGWAVKYTQEGHGLIRIWLGTRPLIVAFSHQCVKEILESNSLIAKGPEYDIFIPWLGTGLLTSTGAKWRRRRKMLTPAFHFNVLRQFIPVFSEQAKRLTEVLSEQDLSMEFDVGPFLKRCALDIICETAMGCSVDAQRDTAHPYVLSTQRLQKLVFAHQRSPWLWIDFIWKLAGYGAEYRKHIDILQGFTLNVIHQRKDDYARDRMFYSGREKKAFLDFLLEMQESEELSDDDIREEVETFMFEGHDTTSHSMGWTLWCLAHYPDVQERVMQELDEVFGNSNRDCTSEDLPKLKYLDRVLKESLRLFPSVPNMSRYAEEDVTIQGTSIPAGCTVLVSPTIIHRTPKLFPDPDEFNPDHFTEDNITARPPYAYIPFSAGPRNCIGQKFAALEEKVVLSWFLRRFRVSSSIGFHENLVCPEVISAPLLGFKMKLERR